MLLIIAAVPLETSLLRKQLRNSQTEQLGSYQIFAGSLFAQTVLIAHTGVGQAAMAIQLTRLLTKHSPQAVLLCGCGGSYPNSGLKNVDLALASCEICADLGVATDAGFLPLEQLDIPQQPELMPIPRQQFALQNSLTNWLQELLPEARFGPFVSVNCCSGYPKLSLELEQRTQGICENMEGAAAAQVCSEFEIPMIELRGISNPTGTRDPQQWNIKRGAEAAQQGLLKILQHGPATQDL